MRVFSKCDIGRIRKSNQDCCRSGLFQNGTAWAIVCDGVGGSTGGDVASKAACDKISACFVSEFSENKTDDEIRSILVGAVLKGNGFIHDLALKNTSLKGMCTTVVAAIVNDKKIHIAYAGDSRAYLVEEDRLTQLTKDHTVVQELIDSGEITPQQALSHPERNCITRALGVASDIKVDYMEHTLTNNSGVILCTDGLTKLLSDNDILVLSQKYTEDVLVENLIKKANERGGIDNITVAWICH